jgi:hypothetical protein
MRYIIDNFGESCVMFASVVFFYFSSLYYDYADCIFF